MGRVDYNCHDLASEHGYQSSYFKLCNHDCVKEQGTEGKREERCTLSLKKSLCTLIPHTQPHVKTLLARYFVFGNSRMRIAAVATQTTHHSKSSWLMMSGQKSF